MQFPADARDADGWLISGSRHGAYEDLPFIAPLETFIREVFSAKIPLIGICFGHQIIAQALGGTVEKFAGGWSVGATEYQLDGEQVMLNAWHHDQVTSLPGTGPCRRHERILQIRFSALRRQRLQRPGASRI